MNNLEGLKVNNLTVIRRATPEEYPRKAGRHAVWLCQCECGNQVFKYSCDLRNGHAISCGCVGREKAVELARQLGEKNRSDLIGKKFGKLTVKSLYKTGPESEKGYTEWLCECECGNSTIIRTNYLVSEHTTSCGCNRVWKRGSGENGMSKGEEIIIRILQKEQIKFIREKTFEDLHHGLYRFDFYLPEKNILIEHDGGQHFSFTKAFHSNRQDFLKAKERDRLKNSYCLAYKIPLYRIPYWEIQNIKSFKDILQNQFLVKSKWHNDNLKIPKSYT